MLPAWKRRHTTSWRHLFALHFLFLRINLNMLTSTPLRCGCVHVFGLWQKVGQPSCQVRLLTAAYAQCVLNVKWLQEWKPEEPWMSAASSTKPNSRTRVNCAFTVDYFNVSNIWCLDFEALVKRFNSLVTLLKWLTGLFRHLWPWFRPFYKGLCGDFVLKRNAWTLLRNAWRVVKVTFLDQSHWDKLC